MFNPELKVVIVPLMDPRLQIVILPFDSSKKDLAKVVKNAMAQTSDNNVLRVSELYLPSFRISQKDKAFDLGISVPGEG